MVLVRTSTGRTRYMRALSSHLIQFDTDEPFQPPNNTAIGYKMWEYTSLVNEIFRLQIPYEVEVSKRFADAGFVLFDTHALLTDIFYNPVQYLNGTTPYDVT